MKADTRFVLRPLAAALLLACGLAHAQSAGETALMKRLDQLAGELAAVKAELATLQQQQRAAAAAPAAAATAAAPAAAPAAVPAGYAANVPAAGEPATVITGYGEVNYNRPKNSSKDAQADLRRAVIGVQHRFDDKTKVVTELEVEHAVTSSDAGDPGEVALEQAYVEHQFTDTWAGRAGLFLIPMGLLNENHDPNAYYGVERNFVETAIIPSTWREGGIQAVGSFDNGLTLQAGVSTGFDIGKWDPAEGRSSPLGTIHQEMATAKARDLSVFGALNWRGVPGLLLGGGLFTGGASHAQTSNKARVTLWDVHARWTPGRWDLAAVYARGSISNSAAFNAGSYEGTFAPIPARFDGGYVQAAYKLWESGRYALKPFVRAERFNTGRRYTQGLGPVEAPNGLPTERVLTAGANFDIGSGVVLKADIQRFKQDKSLDRFDLGLGWSF